MPPVHPWHYLAIHPATLTALTLGFYHILNAVIDSLEMPDATSGKFYRFAFKFANTLAANYNRSKASDGPAGQQPPKTL